jgi:hypothetical protein
MKNINCIITITGEIKVAVSFEKISPKVLEAAKKLDREGYIRINKFEHGENWMQIADEVIDEIALLNEYRIEVKWFASSCAIRKSK